MTPAIQALVATALLAAAPAATTKQPALAPTRAPATAPAAARSAAPAGGPAFLPTRLDGEPWRLGGLTGLAFLEGQTGFALRGDAERPLAQLGPRTRALGLVSLGTALWSTDERVEPGFGIVSETKGWSALFSVIPAVRLTHQLDPRTTLYGDSGLGLAYAAADIESTVRAPGLPEVRTSAGASGLGAVLRFAGGLSYDIDARLRLSAEAGLAFHYGEVRGTVTSLLVGAAWRP